MDFRYISFTYGVKGSLYFIKTTDGGFMDCGNIVCWEIFGKMFRENYGLYRGIDIIRNFKNKIWIKTNHKSVCHYV